MPGLREEQQGGQEVCNAMSKPGTRRRTPRVEGYVGHLGHGASSLELQVYFEWNGAPWRLLRREVTRRDLGIKWNSLEEVAVPPRSLYHYVQKLSHGNNLNVHEQMSG